MLWRDLVRHGEAGCGEAERGNAGKTRRGRARCWPGEAWSDKATQARPDQAGRCAARLDRVRHGKARQAWRERFDRA
jgi:hypothetical protein